MYVIGMSATGEGNQKMDNSSDKVNNFLFLKYLFVNNNNNLFVY